MQDQRFASIGMVFLVALIGCDGSGTMEVADGDAVNVWRGTLRSVSLPITTEDIGEIPVFPSATVVAATEMESPASIPEDTTPSALVSAATRVRASVLWNATEFEGHLYRIFTTRLSWVDAEKTCRQIGGHLASITSKEENTFLVDLMRSAAAPEYTCCWLGARRPRQGYDWEWVSGERFAPVSRLVMDESTDEDYLNLRVSSGNWEDYGPKGEEAGEQWFVCEWNRDEKALPDTAFKAQVTLEESKRLRETTRDWCYISYSKIGGARIATLLLEPDGWDRKVREGEFVGGVRILKIDRKHITVGSGSVTRSIRFGFRKIVSIAAREKSTKTGIMVAPGNTVYCSATGTWSWGLTTNGDGTPGRPLPEEEPVILPGETFGTLIGRIGEGPWFYIGMNNTIHVPNDVSGELIMTMNERVAEPGYYGDNSGHLSVEVIVE